MEQVCIFTDKTLYKEKLMTILSEIIHSNQSIDGDFKAILSECKQRQHGNNDSYEFMLPKLLLSRWISCLEKRGDTNQVTNCLKKLKEATLTLSIPLQEIKIDRSVALFKVNQLALFKHMISTYASDLKSTNLKPHNTADALVICYLCGSASDIRTLCLASLFSHSTFTHFIYISRKPALDKTYFFAKVLNLNINWRNNHNDMDCSSVYRILQNSKFFQNKNKMSEDMGSFVFDDSTSFSEENICSNLFCKVKNTRLILSRNVLCGIYNIDKFIGSEKSNGMKLLHIASHSESLFVRQLYLAYLIYRDLKYNCEMSKHLIEDSIELFHGPINTANSASVVLEKYREDIGDSFKSKYGDSSSWLPLAEKISNSVLKLDIFASSLSSPINKETGSSCTGVSTKFIMYNYSRMATLLNRHNEEIMNNCYPSLPDLEEVNFSLLREDSEKLIVDQLWQLEHLLRKFDDSVTNLDLSHFKPHSLVTFLMQLTRIFSTFYSRHHILGGNLPHLLPTMHARLYLVKSVKNAMNRVFHRLDIIPLDQM